MTEIQVRNEDKRRYPRVAVPIGEGVTARAFTLAVGWLRTYEDKPNTHRAYRLDMFGCRHGPPCADNGCEPSPLAWLRYCAANSQDPIAARTTVVQWWLADLARTGQSPSTRARRLSSVSSYYGYLFREEVIDVNPVARLDAKQRPTPREPGTFGTALSDEQVLALLDAADRDSPCDAALVATAIYCGLRVDSLADLNDDDVTSGAAGPILAYRAKGGKTGRTPLPPPAYQRILAWQASRHHSTERMPTLWTGSGRGRPLFVRRNGNRINEPYVWRLLNRLSVQAGTGRITPHDLRRTFATLALADGAALRDVQRAMGHAMSSTTEGYDMGEFDPERHPAHRLARRHAELRQDGSRGGTDPA